MVKLKLSVITMVLLCVIPTAISSRLQEHDMIENENTESTAAILESNSNQDMTNQQDKAKNVENQTLTYTGVHWITRDKKWKAELTHNKKKYHGGFYENKEHAAMRVNVLCDEFEIQRKNPTIDIEPDTIQQQFKIKTSIYIGVCWNKNAKKWQTKLKHNKENNNGGLFDKEEDAAMKINLLCDKYEMKRKNPMIDIELFEDHQQFKNKTSIYIGVFWDNNAKKWHAEFKHNKKLNYGGLFDNEEHAAMKVNLLCDEFGIKRKNPMIDLEPDAIHQVYNPTSQYIGVSWDKNNKKWRAQMVHKGKGYSAGLFDHEKHAAMKVNLLCDECGIKRKNPNVIMEPDAIQQLFKSKTSIYIGVCWDNNAKKWQTKLIHNKKQHFGGLFHKEEDAAMKVNLLCDIYEVERKNPMIDIELFKDHEVHNPTSQYIGVCWDKNNKKWRAQMVHKEKCYFAGLFNNEKDAAMKVNLLRDELGIKRKNPMIDIELDTIRQKTKSSNMYRSKAENIGNEKEVKVEEENILYGLKDQCENNFMKRSYQSQKRKRKDD